MDSDERGLLVEAVLIREKECAFMRKIAVVAGAVATLIALVDAPYHPLAYALGVLYACIIMGSISYFSFVWYVRGSVREMVEDARLYAETHRDTLSLFILPFGSTPVARCTAQWALGWAFVIAYGMPFFVVEGVSSLSGQWQSYANSGTVLAWGLWGVALGALWDTILWPSQGRAQLAAETGIDAYQLMLQHGYRWTWCWGWRRDRGANTPASPDDMEWQQPKQKPNPTIDVGEWDAAIEAREQQISVHRRFFMMLAAFGLLVSILAARTEGILVVAIAFGYLVVVWLPISAAIAYACNKAAVAQMVERPDLYRSTHSYPMPAQPRLFAPDGPAPWGCSFLALLSLGVVAVPLLARGGTDGAEFTLTILFMAVVGFGIYGLADALVYVKYGRPGLQDRTGIDPIAIMEESAYYWHWYWGWVRKKRHR